MKNRKTRRTLSDVYREILRSRLADFAAWRMAITKFWHLGHVWRALHFRWVNARRRRALEALLANKMSPDWRDTRPKKLRRKLGLLPPVQSTLSTQSTQSTPL